MPRTVKLILGISLLATLAGCGTMHLEHLDRDIPPELLADYKAIGKGEVDSSLLWIPLVHLRQAGVELNEDKMGRYIDARRSIGYLPLFCTGWHEMARYDADGRLQEYTHMTNLLWVAWIHGSKMQDYRSVFGPVIHVKVHGLLFGLLYFDFKAQQQFKGTEETERGFRIVLGLLGYDWTTRGQKTLTFLFIPIPISRGEQPQESPAEIPPPLGPVYPSN